MCFIGWSFHAISGEISSACLNHAFIEMDKESKFNLSQARYLKDRATWANGEPWEAYYGLVFSRWGDVLIVRKTGTKRRIHYWNPSRCINLAFTSVVSQHPFGASNDPQYHCCNKESYALFNVLSYARRFWRRSLGRKHVSEAAWKQQMTEGSMHTTIRYRFLTQRETIAPILSQTVVGKPVSTSLDTSPILSIGPISRHFKKGWPARLNQVAAQLQAVMRPNSRKARPTCTRAAKAKSPQHPKPETEVWEISDGEVTPSWGPNECNEYQWTCSTKKNAVNGSSKPA